MLSNRQMTLRGAMRFLFLMLITYGVIFYVNYIASDGAVSDWYHKLYTSPLSLSEEMETLIVVLLAGMASLAAWFVWPQASHVCYYLLLVTHVMWGWVFYIEHMTFVATLLGGLETVCVVCIMHEFKRFSKQSANLLIPLLVWTVWSTYLNAYIFMYNI